MRWPARRLIVQFVCSSLVSLAFTAAVLLLVYATEGRGGLGIAVFAGICITPVLMRQLEQAWRLPISYLIGVATGTLCYLLVGEVRLSTVILPPIGLLYGLWAAVGQILDHGAEQGHRPHPIVVLKEEAGVTLLLSAAVLIVTWSLFGLSTGGSIVGAFLGAWVAGIFLVSLLEPWIRELRNLNIYLHAMWKPLGAFILGYMTFVVLFAGAYSTLHRLATETGSPNPPFAGDGVSDNVVFTEWVYFSVVSATTLGYGDIRPVGQTPRLLVSIQTLIGIGWLVVGFGAVLAYMQRPFERISMKLEHEGRVRRNLRSLRTPQ